MRNLFLLGFFQNISNKNIYYQRENIQIKFQTIIVLVANFYEQLLFI